MKGLVNRNGKIIILNDSTEYEKCPDCGCKDGNHAQECKIYYNVGYGKRKIVHS